MIGEGVYMWHSADIERLARGGIALAPSEDFALGIVWLANQCNANIAVPERRSRDVQVVEVTK